MATTVNNAFSEFMKDIVNLDLNIPDYFTPPVRSLGTTIPVYGYH